MKNYKIKAEDMVELIPSRMGCIATDKIVVDGEQLTYMYRGEPAEDMPDTGWRFFSGTETQEYIDDLSNSAVYAINTIANYEPAILAYIDMPIGTQLERVPGTNRFEVVKD